jgi:hypothetical protein
VVLCFYFMNPCLPFPKLVNICQTTRKNIKCSISTIHYRKSIMPPLRDRPREVQNHHDASTTPTSFLSLFGLINFLENCYSEGRRPLGRPRRKWEGNIILDPRHMGQRGINWIHLFLDWEQWRDLLNTVINLRIP